MSEGSIHKSFAVQKPFAQGGNQVLSPQKQNPPGFAGRINLLS